MKTFAFIPWQVAKAYTWVISKYRRYDDFFEHAKIIGLFGFLLVCILCYLYFVNMSSTRGYFLKQANQNITTITFQYEILKTKLLDYRQQNRNEIQSTNYKRDIVDISSEVVQLPTTIQLGFLTPQDIN